MDFISDSYNFMKTNTIDSSMQIYPLYETTVYEPTEQTMNTNLSLPSPGTKRNRRMRSEQGQVGGGEKKKGNKGTTYTTTALTDNEITELEENGAPTFLIKTYQMISTCSRDLADWADDGETFVVKNTTKFAKSEIPKYFDHNNFSSFSRQLNFYGFKKVPKKTIRIDQGKSLAKHVKFHNDKFKRGRTDLLPQIQRSTKKGLNEHNQIKEVKILEDKVHNLEAQVSTMHYEIKTLQDQVEQLLNSRNNSYTGREYHLNKQHQHGAHSLPATLAPHPNTRQMDPHLLPSPRHDANIRDLSTGFLENFQIDDKLFMDGTDRSASMTGANGNYQVKIGI